MDSLVLIELLVKMVYGAFTFIEDATNTNNIFTHTFGAVSTVAKEKDDKDYESGTTIVAQANQTYTGLSASGGH